MDRHPNAPDSLEQNLMIDEEMKNDEIGFLVLTGNHSDLVVGYLHDVNSDDYDRVQDQVVLAT